MITELPLKAEKFSVTQKDNKIKAYASLKLSKDQESAALRLPTYGEDDSLERVEQTEISLATSQSQS